jgi:cytochrome c oxidase subunit 2
MDKLMSINIWLITIVFFVVNGLLFYFAYKYYYRKDRKARFFAHDNRLEMIWTLVPGVTLAFIIVYGLITWNHITAPSGAEAVQIEVFSKQFDWTMRYPGENKVFGAASYNLIGTDNALGLVNQERIQAKLEEIDAEIESLEKVLAENKNMPIMPESQVESVQDKIYRLERHKQRILDLKELKDPATGISDWVAGGDDKIVKGELHIPLGKEVEFLFRSQDVIHSAYLPHFRAQMNTVPGVPTRFKMTPTISTKEMRAKLNNDKFDYILLCNKVCGAAHFNMQVKVIVEDEADYLAWLEKQKNFDPELGKKEETPAEEAAPKADTIATAPVAAQPTASNH